MVKVKLSMQTDLTFRNKMALAKVNHQKGASNEVLYEFELRQAYKDLIQSGIYKKKRPDQEETFDFDHINLEDSHFLSSDDEEVEENKTKENMQYLLKQKTMIKAVEKVEEAVDDNGPKKSKSEL